MSAESDQIATREQAFQMTAFASLWSRAQGNVSAYVRAAVRDPHDAEDVLQEIAEAAARDFGAFDNSRSFVAWVIGIARFRILKYLDRRSRDRHVFNDSTLTALAEAYVDIAPEVDDRREALRQCMSALQPRGRKIIEMRYLRSLTPDAIANQIGASTNAVSIVLHRTRKLLADCITRHMRRVEEIR